MTNKERYLNDIKDNVRKLITAMLDEYEQRVNGIIISTSNEEMFKRYQSETVDAINEVIVEEYKNYRLHWDWNKYDKNSINIWWE